VNLPTPEGLKERRKGTLTQSELAERAGVSQPLIARIEGGGVDPRLSTLRRIVEELDEARDRVVRARDVMSEEIVSVSPDDAVSDALTRMEDEAYSQLPVLDGGSASGSISYVDVYQAGGGKKPVGQLCVKEVMSKRFLDVTPDAPLDEVGSLLRHDKAVVVTDGNEAVGIVTEADLAAAVS
jgi:transcriptional regulator, XRE family